MLKRFLIPHKSNGHQPHIFRPMGIAIIAVILTAIFGIYTLQTRLVSDSNMLANIVASTLIQLTNNDRQINNQNQLAYSPKLEQVAQSKANDMAQKGYFAHTSPEGLSPWYWFDQVGYRYIFAGENLAMDFSDSVIVEQAWMNSPTHKANIINPVFTEIGIATQEGIYQGRKTTFVVQVFAKPLKFNNTASVIEAGNLFIYTILTSPNTLFRILFYILIAVVVFSLIMLLIIEASRKKYKQIIVAIIIIAILILIFRIAYSLSLSSIPLII